MRTVMMVGVGGAAGAMLRYGLGGLVQQRAGAGFAAGILTVNVLGCFVSGMLSHLIEAREDVGGEIPEGLATMARVQARWYRPGKTGEG